MPLPQGTSIANLNSIQLKTKGLQSKNVFFYYFNQPDSLTHSQVQYIMPPKFCAKGTHDWWVPVGSYWVLVGSARFLF